MMRIHDLSPSKGEKKNNKRVGRGPGSGHGKTSCRGHKGQKSRSGGSVPPGFEGGQMPLQRRLPKRGFTNIFKKQYAVINIADLQSFEANTRIDTEVLQKSGLVRRVKDGIKLLGKGDISQPLEIHVQKISRTAREKILAAGGKVEVI